MAARTFHKAQEGSRRKRREGHQYIFSSFAKPLVMICLLCGVLSSILNALRFASFCDIGPEQEIYSDMRQNSRAGVNPSNLLWKLLHNRGDLFESAWFSLVFFNSGLNETMLRICVTSERIKDQKATWDSLFLEQHKMVSYFKNAFPDLIAQLVPA